jgi:Ni,Fe-hydrogenase III large subunit
MSESQPVVSLANGGAVPRSQIPRLPLDAFRGLVIGATKRGRRVAALFGTETADGGMELIVVLAADADGVLDVGSTALTSNTFPSMTPECPEVHLFEREIAEQWGILPEGHPWLKPVRFSAPLRDRRNGATPTGGATTTIGVMDFYRMEGEEAHEVAVGPVHAGVIEPGHFRFQCHGEQVFHLEISLGYQHRGVERALVGGPDKRTIHFFETLAGDTTVGHATAHCQAVEALGRTRVPGRALALRAIGLELERLANHTGGLGALANDVGFLPTASFCGRLRGDYLNLSAALCGSRFGRGLVRPGGVGFDVDGERLSDMSSRLDRAYRDTEQAVKLLWDSPSVMARFEDTGRVDHGVARQLGLVGVAGRACGLKRDVRKTHPSGYFRFTHIPISTWTSGDVFSRAYVRWLEIERSVDFLRTQLRHLPSGPTLVSPGPLRPEHLAISLVEGWRGEICHVALTDQAGRLAAYKVVDPSFHNWSALAMALRDQQISDFPLCNKSFDLSYCGFDL